MELVGRKARKLSRICSDQKRHEVDTTKPVLYLSDTRNQTTNDSVRAVYGVSSLIGKDMLKRRSLTGLALMPLTSGAVEKIGSLLQLLRCVTNKASCNEATCYEAIAQEYLTNIITASRRSSNLA